MVRHLQLSVPSTPQSGDEEIFCEDSVSLIIPLIMVASEPNAIGSSIFILLAEKRYILISHLSVYAFGPQVALNPPLCQAGARSTEH